MGKDRGGFEDANSFLERLARAEEQRERAVDRTIIEVFNAEAKRVTRSRSQRLTPFSEMPLAPHKGGNVQ